MNFIHQIIFYSCLFIGFLSTQSNADQYLVFFDQLGSRVLCSGPDNFEVIKENRILFCNSSVKKIIVFQYAESMIGILDSDNYKIDFVYKISDIEEKITLFSSKKPWPLRNKISSIINQEPYNLLFINQLGQLVNNLELDGEIKSTIRFLSQRVWNDIKELKKAAKDKDKTNRDRITYPDENRAFIDPYNGRELPFTKEYISFEEAKWWLANFSQKTKCIMEGCEQRAYLMAYALERAGIRSKKIWISGEEDLEAHPNPFCLHQPHGDWSYHVAPAVYVQNSRGQIHLMVLDPVLDNLPLSLTKWCERMGVTLESRKKISQPLIMYFHMTKDFTEPSIYISEGPVYWPGFVSSMFLAEYVDDAEGKLRQFEKEEAEAREEKISIIEFSLEPPCHD